MQHKKKADVIEADPMIKPNMCGSTPIKVSNPGAYTKAVQLFISGKTLKEVAKDCDIAYATAAKIRKDIKEQIPDPKEEILELLKRSGKKMVVRLEQDIDKIELRLLPIALGIVLDKTIALEESRSRVVVAASFETSYGSPTELREKLRTALKV